MKNTEEVGCSTHPRAPHGFDRNASHNADRYVCDCEHFDPMSDKEIIDYLVNFICEAHNCERVQLPDNSFLHGTE